MSVVNMIPIVFYSLLLFKVLKSNFYTKSRGCTTPELQKNPKLYYQRESRIWIPPPQPVPIPLCQEVPSFWVGAGRFSGLSPV